MTKHHTRRHRRHRRHRRRRRGGQALTGVIHKALLPASLYYLQKNQQRKSRRGGKTRHKRHKRRKYHKGSKSKTRRGRKDFLTHFGSNVFDEAGHFVKRAIKPFTRGGSRHRHRRRSRR